MAKNDALKKVSKAHTVYKTDDGTRVVGTTTVLSVLNKPALIKWSNDLGLQGIDSAKYTDASARIGTLAHYLVECYFKKKTPNTDDYSANELNIANNCLSSFYNWGGTHNVEIIESELSLVSEKYKYGGTIDIIAIVDGVMSIVDIKTGSGIYIEHYYQVCAYRQLALESDFDIKQVIILNIPRKETEDFQEKIYTYFYNGWEIFKHCLAIYNLKKDKSF